MMKPKIKSLNGESPPPDSENPTKVCQEKNSNVIEGGTKKTRASDRLRAKQRRKELANHRKFYYTLESQARDLLSDATLEFENPCHKILFLTRLGLAPASEEQVPAELRVPRAKVKKEGSQNSDSDLSPESRTSDTDNSLLPDDSSEEVEQDLELMISPVDIPEIFHEMSRTRPVVEKRPIIPRNAIPTMPNKAKKSRKDNNVGRSARTIPRVPSSKKNTASSARTSSEVNHRDVPLDLSSPSTTHRSQFTNFMRHTVVKTISNPGSQPQQSLTLPIKIPKMQAVLLPIPSQKNPNPLIPHQNIPLFCRPLMKQLPKSEEIPCIDLTSEEDEERDSISAIRKKLLSLDTILEFADRR